MIRGLLISVAEEVVRRMDCGLDGLGVCFGNAEDVGEAGWNDEVVGLCIEDEDEYEDAMLPARSRRIGLEKLALYRLLFLLGLGLSSDVGDGSTASGFGGAASEANSSSDLLGVNGAVTTTFGGAGLSYSLNANASIVVLIETSLRQVLLWSPIVWTLSIEDD